MILPIKYIIYPDVAFVYNITYYTLTSAPLTSSLPVLHKCTCSAVRYHDWSTAQYRQLFKQSLHEVVQPELSSILPVKRFIYTGLRGSEITFERLGSTKLCTWMYFGLPKWKHSMIASLLTQQGVLLLVEIVAAMEKYYTVNKPYGHPYLLCYTR